MNYVDRMFLLFSEVKNQGPKFTWNNFPEIVSNAFTPEWLFERYDVKSEDFSIIQLYIKEYAKEQCARGGMVDTLV